LSYIFYITLLYTSIYNPPSKTQSVFNPSNYGGLGAGGQITTDYLDANYIAFPVAQGNTTLVGTNILGDVTQQGDFTTTGDITGETFHGSSFLVGTTNLLSEIGTKQDKIQDGDLTIAKTDGLQTALDNKYDDTGGTINGNVNITGGLLVGTTNIITELGNKQPTIQDGDLTIAKTDGLQTALNGKQPTIEDGDLTIAKTDGLQTALNWKQPTIEDGDLTIANTDGLQTALDNKYDDTGGTINGNVDITGDLIVDSVNIINEIGTKQDEITTSTDLSCNSLNTNDLIVNESLNVDNVITYEKDKYFNAAVIRRFDGSITDDITLGEFQIWVNNTNIVYANADDLDAYFANWSDKDTPLTANTTDGIVNDVNPYLFNNTIE